MAVLSALAVEMAAVAIDRPRMRIGSTHGDDTGDQQYSDPREYSLGVSGLHVIIFLGSFNFLR